MGSELPTKLPEFGMGSVGEEKGGSEESVREKHVKESEGGKDMGERESENGSHESMYGSIPIILDTEDADQRGNQFQQQQPQSAESVDLAIQASTSKDKTTESLGDNVRDEVKVTESRNLKDASTQTDTEPNNPRKAIPHTCSCGPTCLLISIQSQTADYSLYDQQLARRREWQFMQSRRLTYILAFLRAHTTVILSGGEPDPVIVYYCRKLLELKYGKGKGKARDEDEGDFWVVDADEERVQVFRGDLIGYWLDCVDEGSRVRLDEGVVEVAGGLVRAIDGGGRREEGRRRENETWGEGGLW